MEPVKGVHLVPDPCQGRDPLGNQVPEDEADAVTEEASRPEVDYIVSNRWQVDESFAPIVSDRHVGNQSHLVLVQGSLIYLVGSRQDCLL